MNEFNDLLERALACQEQGQEEEAISLYRQLLELAPHLSMAHFNIGLLYKHRGEWEHCFHHNQRATDLNPEDDGAWWNLGIAATVMEQWKVARQAWNHFGLGYPLIDQDPADHLGSTPIRINPRHQGEVVWAIRLDPCRAQIVNIPLPESNHRYQDIVLNDGSPNGYRMVNGVEYAVLDELQLLGRSGFETYSIRCAAVPDHVFEDLEQRCEAQGIGIENWTTQTRMICRQCSEGRPHEVHDHDLDPEFSPDTFLIGFASRSEASLTQVLNRWSEDHSVSLEDYAFYPLDADEASLGLEEGGNTHRVSGHIRKKQMLNWLKDKQN